MKIVISGGHHISALSLAKVLMQKKHHIFWFGCRFPRWPEKTEGEEYKQVRAARITFYYLMTGKFHKNLNKWWRIPFGLFQAIWYLHKIKPDLIFSFGGYLAVPTVLAGWLSGIPSFTHEQTCTAGLANRFLKYFVKKIFITWPQSAIYFPKGKIVLSGLPLRTEFFKKSENKIFKKKLVTILVAGGKQGSHIINQKIGEILPKLLKRFNLIHQTGNILAGADFFRFKTLRDSLLKSYANRYYVKDFFQDNEWVESLKACDFFIGRSGAHTVYELAMVGKPAIFIPLPFSYANEQEKNARLFADIKAGEIIEQKNLNSKNLSKAINKLNLKLNFYRKNVDSLAKLVNKDADRKIAEYIEKYTYENEKKIETSKSF